MMVVFTSPTILKDFDFVEFKGGWWPYQISIFFSHSDDTCIYLLTTCEEGTRLNQDFKIMGIPLSKGNLNKYIFSSESVLVQLL